MVAKKAALAHKVVRVPRRENGSARIGVLADTHSVLRPRLLELLAALRPDAILHAGDVGELGLLDQLATVAPVLAVRGNIDPPLPELPDELVVELAAPERLGLRVLLLHVGMNGLRLRPEVARRARAEAASLVVCGHSHVPFLGSDHGLSVFNPGSAGPRRFGLPVVFGTLELGPSGVHLAHVEIETGLAWQPSARAR